MTRRLRLVVAGPLAAGLLGACSTLAPADATRPVPRLEGLGAWRTTMSGASPAAQRWIDQGVLLAYGFEHGRAARAFEQALREDPDCAMCAWGAAYVLGPNINRPRSEVDLPALKRAHGFAQQAAAIAAGQPAGRVSARDARLIAAMQERYDADPKPTPETPAASETTGPGGPGSVCSAAGSPFSGDAAAAPARETAYARAMAEAHARHPDDVDVAALYAESLMMLTPWSWYGKNKQPHANTRTAIDVIRRALAAAPQHPGLIHFLIHATEQGPDATWAEAPADRLGAISPGLPHLVHMPSHTYIRVGRYGDAARVNQRALEADVALAAAIRAQGGEPGRNWDFHHLHFLWFAAAMDGQGRVAVDAARRLSAKFGMLERIRGGWAADLAAELPWLAMVQVERWGEILSTELPRPWYRHERAVAHYARGMALARGLGQADDALGELASLEVMAGTGERDPVEAAAPTLRIAVASLRGEVAWARGDREQALHWLKRAQELERSIDGGEVASFGSITAPALGTALLAAGRAADAEKVYREQLEAWPGDPRALQGLERSLAALGRTAEAQANGAAFRAAWVRADFLPARR
ncbi:MAG: hypothetical protein JNN18_04415 [Rubrivivax sp.]|nr:hypothetical protein [Rubrivivax sp.]